jgi:glycerol-3-phosphate dehydrogenase
MTTPAWSSAERDRALERAERDGVDLLVVGGGITGAGVLRDAASRGLRALLVEREDFAAGTSGRSSKMVHGGMRYLEGGHVGLTRESCAERDLMIRLNPHLVQLLPFLLPSYEGGRLPIWKIRGALFAYAAVANFRRTARGHMLDPDEVATWCPDLRQEGLHGAGLFYDGQVDDARLVLETLRSARSLGAEAVNHAEVIEFLRDAQGRVAGVRLRDAVRERTRAVRALAVVNAAGPAVERVRGLDRPLAKRELRPAKGVHLVIPRGRVRSEAVVSFEAADRRSLFLAPWEDVAYIGTTDDFTEEIDEPVVTIDEVHYLLSAANEAFPRAGLTTNDIRSVFAGVRPLAASEDETVPPSSVSREHRIYEDPSGLISVAGGKLTTHRAMGAAVVERALAQLPAGRRAGVGRSRTASLPLRDESYEPAELEEAIRSGYGLDAAVASRLVRYYGADAERLLREAPAAERHPIGTSRFTYAELRWSQRTECPVTLCDLLERRVRLALFAIGQGLPELSAIARVVGEAAGWDAERSAAEAAAYAAAVRRRYQIQASPGSRKPRAAWTAQDAA